ncbi:MAG: response regulator [Oscillospiraceae bacterium]|jgi:putative two-component system response regulator|nr:response regulator [Oscillospiraceae bacterium]
MIVIETANELAMRPWILIVEDVPTERTILREILSGEYEVMEATNGKEALKLIQEYGESFAMVIMDIAMPEMGGLEVLNVMREDGVSGALPVCLVTASNDETIMLEAHSLGVADIIIKPVNPLILLHRVKNLIALYSYRMDIEIALREQRELLELQQQRALNHNRFMIDALATAVEYRSLESGEHMQRVKELTRFFLNRLSVRGRCFLTGDEIDTAAEASVLHDIGKISISDTILMKPGRLTAEEYDIMKQHTTKGAEMLERVRVDDSQYYAFCCDIARSHHERWDGTGYPDGLIGDATPIWAQAAALADVYDALTNERVYKPKYSHEESIRMIIQGECGVFNPDLLECLEQDAELLRDFRK